MSLYSLIETMKVDTIKRYAKPDNPDVRIIDNVGIETYRTWNIYYPDQPPKKITVCDELVRHVMLRGMDERHALVAPSIPKSLGSFYHALEIRFVEWTHGPSSAGLHNIHWKAIAGPRTSIKITGQNL